MSRKFSAFGSQNSDSNVEKPSSAFSSLPKSESAVPKAGGVFGSISLGKAAPELPKRGNVFGSIALASGRNSDSAPIGIRKSGSAAPAASDQPQSKMQKLNKSFMSWLDKQLVNHSVSNWTAGLEDYLKHADKIAATLPQEPVGVAASTAKPPASSSVAGGNEGKVTSAPSCGGFGQSATAGSAAAKPAAAFSGFSVPPATTAPSDAPHKPSFGGGFSSAAATATATATMPKPAAFSGFSAAPASSGAPAAAAAAKVPNFGSFSSANTASKPPAAFSGFGGFGGGAAFNSAAPAPAPAVSSGDGGEDEYEGEPILPPETIHKNENDTDEILYETDCKAFRFDSSEKEWKESGKGPLRITQEPGVAKKKILVRNAIGKITINAYIMKGMNFRKSGKAGLQFLAVVDASGKPQSFLVKVKPSEVDLTVQKFKHAEENAT